MYFLRWFFLIITLLPLLLIAQPQTNDEQLAVQYFSNKEFEKAAELFEKLYDKRPDAYYYTYYFQTLIELKQYKEAEKVVKKQRRKNDNLPRYNVDLGYIYEVSNEPSKAKKEYENAIEELKPEQNQISDLANAFIIRRQNDLAIETYKKGRKLLNNQYIFSIEIAQIHQREGNIALMMDEYLNLIDQDPKNINDIQVRLQGVFIDDNDGSKYEAIRTSILKRTQKYPDKIGYAVLMYWLSLQHRDFDIAFIQVKSIDKRFKDDSRVFEFANIAKENRAWSIATQAFNYIIDKGEKNDYYFGSRLQLLDVTFQELTSSFSPDIKKIEKLDKEYTTFLIETEFNNQVVSLIRNQAHLKAFYLNQTIIAQNLLDSALKIPGIAAKDKAECKIDLADILLFNNDVWEATLLYSQVEKDFPNDTIGHEAKFRNAKLSFYIGEFEWAKAQLDVLRAATTKLIANDAMQLYMLIADNEDDDSTNIALMHYANADLMFYRKKDDEAMKYLDSIAMLGLYHSLFDEVLYKRAEIMIRKGNYIAADSLLLKLADFYNEDILADDALFLAAELNQYYLKNSKKALDLYQKIITDYSSSMFVIEARKRFRELRGE